MKDISKYQGIIPGFTHAMMTMEPSAQEEVEH